MAHELGHIGTEEETDPRAVQSLAPPPAIETPVGRRKRELEEEEARQRDPVGERKRQLLEEEAATGQEEGTSERGALPELSEEQLNQADTIVQELLDDKDLKLERRPNILEDMFETASEAMLIGTFAKMSPENKRLTLEIAGSLTPIPGSRVVVGGSILARFPFLAKAMAKVFQLIRRSGAPGAVAGAGISETFDTSDDLEEALARLGLAGGTAIAGQKGGELITKFGGKIARPGIEKLEKGAKVAIQSLKEVGEVLTPARAGTGFGIDLVEAVADMAVFGGQVLAKASESATTAAESAIKIFFQTFKKQASKEQIGALLQETLDGGTTTFQEIGRQVFNVIDTQAGNTLVDVRASKLIAKNIVDTSDDVIPAGTLKTIAASIAKQDDEVPWERAQKMRSQLLGITRQQTDLVAGETSKAVKTMAKSVDTEMALAAKELGGNALEAWRFANAYWKGGKDLFNSTLFKQIVKKDAEAVYDAVIKNGEPGNIRKVREVFEFDRIFKDGKIIKVPRKSFKEDWANIQGQFLDDILKNSTVSGEVIQSVEFGTLAPIDGSKLIQAFDRLGEDSLKELFPDAIVRKRFNDLTRTLRLTQRRDKGGRLQMAIAVGQGGALTAVIGFGGFDKGTFAKGLAVLFTPRLIAKIFVSKLGNKWLTIGLTAPRGSAEAIEATAKLFTFLGRPDLASISRDIDIEAEASPAVTVPREPSAFGSSAFGSSQLRVPE